MSNVPYWYVTTDWRVSEVAYKFRRQADGFDLVNDEQMHHATTLLAWTKPAGYFGNAVIPVAFPRPELKMPNRGFAPDYLRFGGWVFVSRRLRDAIAQPEHVVQYHPISILAGGPDVLAQDYRWMNVLAFHPAIDMQLSDVVLSETINRETGERLHYIQSYNRMVLRSDMKYAAEIFRVAEDYGSVLASDALADRVIRAGCVGVVFEDPATARSSGPIHRYRTETGVEEEDMNDVLGPAR